MTKCATRQPPLKQESVNSKSEIRNKFKSGEKREMRKTGGGGLSANFANFREFFGRGRKRQNHDRTESWGGEENPRIARILAN
jgi:hypothetical protein